MFLTKNNNVSNEILSHSKFIEFVCNSANDNQNVSIRILQNTYFISKTCVKTRSMSQAHQRLNVVVRNVFASRSNSTFVLKFKKRLSSHCQDSRNEHSIHHQYFTQREERKSKLTINERTIAIAISTINR